MDLRDVVEVVRVRMIGWKGRRANGGFGRDPGERRLWRTVPGSVRGYAGGDPESSQDPQLSTREPTDRGKAFEAWPETPGERIGWLLP